jgi:AcrR family transcriptional regulator
LGVLPATQPLPPTAAGERNRLRIRKKEYTRLAIEDAALDLFAEQGYEVTTVDQIAHRAEVSKATFFRYFGTKGEVIFGSDPDRHDDLQQAIIGRPASETDLEAVHSAMQQQWLPTLDPERTTRQTRAARTSPVLRGLSHDLSMRWQADVSDALAQRRQLDVPDRRCRLAAGVAFAVLSNGVNLWMDRDCLGDLGAAIDEGFELLNELCSEGREGASPY